VVKTAFRFTNLTYGASSVRPHKHLSVRRQTTDSKSRQPRASRWHTVCGMHETNLSHTWNCPLSDCCCLCSLCTCTWVSNHADRRDEYVNHLTSPKPTQRHSTSELNFIYTHKCTH